MKRVTVAGTTDDAPDLLDALQDLGCFHVIPLEERASREPARDGSQRARQALRYLLGAPNRRRELADASDFDYEDVVERALENRRQRIEVQHRIDALAERIASVEPWGDFEFPALDAVGGVRLWFYVVPSHARQKLPQDIPSQVISRDGRSVYVVLLSATEPPADAMPVPRTHVGARSLSTLRRELEAERDRMEDIQAERSALTKWVRLLLVHLGEADDAHARGLARASSLEDGRVFVAQGWVPEPDVARVQERCSGRAFACVAEDPSAADDPPVKLENAPVLDPGEDLVEFYQLPGYRDFDPSAFVYLTFVFFFAVIIADAGYSAMLLAGTILLWRRLGSSTSGHRTRRLALSISAFGIVYGVIAGSYFGIELSPDGPLAQARFLDVNDFEVMMPLSLGVGVLHLVGANLMAAWARRRSLTSVASLGWTAALIGGFSLYLGSSSGWWALGLGLMAVFCCSSERPVRRAADVFMRGIDGCIALTGVSRAFGDVLSYLRLFALGLSSASLAATFNQLGSNVMGGGQGVGLVAGLLVWIVGHSLNFALGMVGGVVHGLRLNVIELYNWSIFGEGRPFRPLSKRKLDHVRGEHRPQET